MWLSDLVTDEPVTATPARRRRRARPGRARPRRRRRRGPRAAQRERRRADLAGGRRRPLPDDGADPAPRRAAAPGRPAHARRWPSPAPSSAAIAGQLAARRLPGLGGGVGGQRRRRRRRSRPRLRRRRRRRPRPRRPAVGGHGARPGPARLAGARPSRGDGRAPATASAAWPCGACAPTRSTSLAAAAVLVVAVAALLVADRLRLEPLTRRADLVSQLRFAVTMQDLRTVVLLRRQLRGERPRSTPWVAHRPLARRRRRRPAPCAHAACAASPATRRRGSRAWPLLAVLAGLAVVAVLRGTTPAMLGVGVALYLLGLDAIEPLSQEIDHPDVADGVPHPRGLAAAPPLRSPRSSPLSPFAVDRRGDRRRSSNPSAAAAAFALAFPVTVAGACGSVVSVVRDAADPLQASTHRAVPPEFAGFSSFVRARRAARHQHDPGAHGAGDARVPDRRTAVRMAVLDVLVDRRHRRVGAQARRVAGESRCRRRSPNAGAAKAARP